jgi:gluconokinase
MSNISSSSVDSAVDRPQIIITIDVGSSSVRSSAYYYASCWRDDDDDDSGAGGSGTLIPSSSPSIISMASASRPHRSVQPNTGKIALQGGGGEDGPSLMDLVDQCVDETLRKLRAELFDRDQQQWEVLGIGFSTFVMNLVGVSADGDVVGEEASISYACNSAAVGKEVQALKRYA